MRRLTPAATEKRLVETGVEGTTSPAFAFIDDDRQVSYAPHVHTRHQLLYAFEGSVRLELDDATYVLPPQRAAFIPAGVWHGTTIRDVRIGSVYFERTYLTAPATVRVIEATPLLREMVVYAARWPPQHDPHDPVAEAFFRCFARLCGEWLQRPLALRMPRGQSPELRRVIAALGEDLAGASLTRAARGAGMSARSLRRRMHDETGVSFRELLMHARLIRAMELLGEPYARVTDVALAVGYDSLSAFAKSFLRLSGETPSAYRARVLRERV